MLINKSSFCRAPREAPLGARKSDSDHTTSQNVEILHISCYSIHQENSNISIGKRWMGYAFQCCGWDSRHSADDPWLPP